MWLRIMHCTIRFWKTTKKMLPHAATMISTVHCAILRASHGLQVPSLALYVFTSPSAH